MNQRQVRLEQEESVKELESAKTERDLAVAEAGATREERAALKTLVLESKEALLASSTASSLPLKRLNGKDLPDFYRPMAVDAASAATESVPWDKDERRAMTPAEGVGWLAAELERKRGD